MITEDPDWEALGLKDGRLMVEHPTGITYKMRECIQERERLGRPLTHKEFTKFIIRDKYQIFLLKNIRHFYRKTYFWLLP